MALPVLGSKLQLLPSDSGTLPSIIRSIEPELSSKMRTFGGGGFVSVCCARARPEIARIAIPASAAAASDRVTWFLMSDSFLPDDSSRTLDRPRDDARSVRLDPF